MTSPFFFFFIFRFLPYDFIYFLKRKISFRYETVKERHNLICRFADTCKLVDDSRWIYRKEGISANLIEFQENDSSLKIMREEQF